PSSPLTAHPASPPPPAANGFHPPAGPAKFTPESNRGKRKKGLSGGRLAALMAVLLVLVGGGGALAVYFTRGHGDRADLLFHTVRKEPLEVTIVERGTLEAADNKDVVCMVKAGARG